MFLDSRPRQYGMVRSRPGSPLPPHPPGGSPTGFIGYIRRGYWVHQAGLLGTSDGVIGYIRRRYWVHQPGSPLPPPLPGGSAAARGYWVYQTGLLGPSDEVIGYIRRGYWVHQTGLLGTSDRVIGYINQTGITFTLFEKSFLPDGSVKMFRNLSLTGL